MPFYEWNQHRLFFRQQGTGALLVILPGNTASSALLQGELTYFSDRFHVVAPDFWGTGQSDRVAIWADQWWFQGAHQIAALINHLGYEQALLMGASGGAVAALLTAIHFPQYIRGVIADSFVDQAPPEAFRDRVIADRSQRTPDQIKFWQTAHGDDWEQVVNADTAMLERFANQGANWFQGQLDQVQCPVLLTASLRDSLIQPVIQNFCGMVEKIPDCRLYLHHKGGHPLIWSEPGVFRAVSDCFLQVFSSDNGDEDAVAT